ncbi:MAG: hypothetical protein ABII71_05690 [Candidatus Micrarchaeota archaeon]
MHSDIVTNRRLAMMIVAVQLLLLGALVFYPDGLIAIAAIFSFIAAAAVWRFGFLLKPLIARQANILEGFGKYEIPPSQDIILKKEGNRYYAAAYLLVRFTQSSTEKGPEQIALLRQSYERALSSLNYVYKISNMVCPVELAPYVDDIKERRSKAETRLSELSSLPASANQGSDMARLKREIESCGSQLERIQSGERPMRVMNYAMTCASSLSRDDAIAKARQQAAELKTLVASTLDTEILQLSGDDMKRCFEWEHMLPGKDESEEFLY